MSELHDKVCKLDLPNDVLSYLLKELADAEVRMAGSTDDRIQLSSLVAIFAIASQKILESKARS